MQYAAACAPREGEPIPTRRAIILNARRCAPQGRHVRGVPRNARPAVRSVTASPDNHSTRRYVFRCSVGVVGEPTRVMCVEGKVAVNAVCGGVGTKCVVKFGRW